MTPTYDATNDIYGPEGPPTASSVIASASRAGSPGSHLRVAGGATQTASHGSRTMTITVDPTQTEGEDAEEEDVHGVLELTGGPSEARRVQWDDDVVDNEHLGKKKSKSTFC